MKIGDSVLTIDGIYGIIITGPTPTTPKYSVKFIGGETREYEKDEICRAFIKSKVGDDRHKYLTKKILG
ncbi:hypothetical protein LCGC14_0501040 [marine sediment metagenome]|uniref:Uncharacterized protein n=1 Tax=marine sediment metagenome TaxID=412755 RepID=A0A0F9S8Z0_9ZZZZ|nr:hypothetical protein [Pricia sp.]